MMQESIIENISKHIYLNENEIFHFLALVREKHFEHGDQILKEGQLCKEINFVSSGTLRAYFVDKTGRESTIMFAVTGWWVTDMYCFVQQKPAMLNIEAIQSSSVLQLQKTDMDNLLTEVPKFEKFFRIIFQNAYIREQLRVIENFSLSAAERHRIFLEKYPHIAAQVTQKQIASYLGITPEFLSVIRSRKRKGRIS